MNWRSTIEEIFPHREGPAADSSSYERFAIPYKFQPRLSVGDAAAFALSTFLRIFLGSVLFGAWGAFSLREWNDVHNIALRLIAVLALFAAFIALLGLMLIGTSRLLPRHPRPLKTSR